MQFPHQPPGVCKPQFQKHCAEVTPDAFKLVYLNSKIGLTISTQACLPSMKPLGMALGVRISYLSKKHKLTSVKSHNQVLFLS